MWSKLQVITVVADCMSRLNDDTCQAERLTATSSSSSPPHLSSLLHQNHLLRLQQLGLTLTGSKIDSRTETHHRVVAQNSTNFVSQSPSVRVDVHSLLLTLAFYIHLYSPFLLAIHIIIIVVIKYESVTEQYIDIGLHIQVYIENTRR